jgi:hypothetical protein
VWEYFVFAPILFTPTSSGIQLVRTTILWCGVNNRIIHRRMIILLVKWEVCEREGWYPGIYVEGVRIVTETDRVIRLAGTNSYNFCFYNPQALCFCWKFIIIMYSNNNFNGKCWAIGGPKLSGPPGDQDYRRTTVFCSTTWPWSSCLRHCATSRKVEISIPVGLIGIFHESIWISWQRWSLPPSCTDCL